MGTGELSGRPDEMLGGNLVMNWHNNNNNKDFIYRGGHVTAEKLTNLWPI